MTKKLFSTYLPFIFVFCFVNISGCIPLAQAQIISTIAGTGAYSYGGDGLPATAAKLAAPTSLAIDGSGNIFISDDANNRIRKIDAAGIITTIAGNGTPGYTGDGTAATNAEMNGPGGIRADAAGNIYFADIGNNCIRKVNALGIISTVAGTGTGGYNGDGIAATVAQINAPYGIALDRPGNLYIAERYNNRVRKVNTAGIISTIAGTGAGGFSGDGGPATAAKFDSPIWVTTDNNGNIYISDSLDIRKVDTFGIVTNFAGRYLKGFGGDGGPATAAQLWRPDGLFADQVGNIYFADGGNARIRKVNTFGIITNIAGSGCTWPCYGAGYSGDGGRATAALISSTDVTIDCMGNLYLADQGNNRIRKISVVNHGPSFAGGHMQSLYVCSEPAPDTINSLLAVNDADTAQTETWSAVMLPAHGTLSVAFSAVNITGVVVPSGLYYTPVSGYTGTDTFKVAVSDCGGLCDTTTIYVTVNAPPVPGVITGTDTVCKGHTIALSDTATGGIWSISNAHAAVTTGKVTGLTAGTDTVAYTVVVAGCSPAVAHREVYVVDCPLGAGNMKMQQYENVKVYPNPNNGTFTINVSASVNEEARVVITNMLGQAVREIACLTNKNIEVQLVAPAGVYFISVVTREGIMNEKVMVGR